MKFDKARLFAVIISILFVSPILKTNADVFPIITQDFYTTFYGDGPAPHFQTTTHTPLGYSWGTTLTCGPSGIYCKHESNCADQWRDCVNNLGSTLINDIYSTCLGGKVLANQGNGIYCHHGGCGGDDTAHRVAPTTNTGTTYIGLCPPLANSNITFSATADSGSLFPGSVSTVYDGQILHIREGGNYTVNWNCGNDKNTTTHWDGSNSPLGAIPATHQGSENPASVERGIYIYDLSCTGTDHDSGLNLNGQSLEGKIVGVDIIGKLPDIISKYGKDFLRTTTIRKTITIYVGDIPPAPVINDFSFVVSSDTDLQIATTTPPSARLQIGKSFQVHWDVSNVSPDQVGTSAAPITIYQMVNGVKTTLFSTKDPSGTKKITPSRTGFYTIGIDVVNPEFVKLGTFTEYLPLNVYSPNVAQTVSVQFSATKTSIKSGEASTLTWNADAAKTVTITPDIGTVQSSGTLDVTPTVTTNYTLKATSIFSDVGATTKVLTIRVGNATSTLAESITNEADCLANNYYWYNNSCHDSPQIVAPPEEQFKKQEGAPTEQTVDLKANGSDGPITLHAPANFKLSWNIDGYCLATGSWLDVKFKAGSQNMTVNKNGKYTYSLYCAGYGSDSVEVDVVGGTGSNADTGLLDSLSGKNTDGLSNVPTPVAEAVLSTDKINYSQNITVIKGKPTDIYIKADQDTSGDGLASRDETGQWTDLMSNGGRCLYNTKLVKGVPQFDGMIESPSSVEACNAKLGSYVFNDQPGTYQYGIMELMENTNKFSNIAYVSITVENPPPQTGAPEIDMKINGNDSAEQILATPASYSLTWNVTNADTCEASGSWNGTKDLQGVQSFVSSAAKNFTYTLNCIGQLGTTTKSIALEVMESPVCQFTALPPVISKQSSFVTQSELSWKCDYADECSMAPDVGIPVKTYGSVRVSPDITTNYELTCLNSATSTKFDVTVGVQ